jgi:hypothetical protein
MSGRLQAALLRFYPPAWRARYGAELENLILASRADGEPAWRTGLDVIAAGSRERLRHWGLGRGDEPENDRTRGGLLLVLASWALLTIGGAGVQKFSEHWQSQTPSSQRPIPAAAFEVLVIAGAVGCLLVAVAILLASPRLLAFLRSGGWQSVRRAARRATLMTIVTLGATAGLVIWAHQLAGPERNGADFAYSLAFLLWGATGAATLLCWSALTLACAGRIELSGRLLRAEAGLGVGVACSAITATAAAGVWWGALAADAPWVLHGGASGSGGSVLAVPLLLATATMAIGSVIAGLGAWRCAGGLSSLAQSQRPL